MPGMSGLEATARIRAMPGERFRTLPIVAFTANALAGTRDMFLANGFNDYLAKPIELVKLNAVVTQWIPREKHRQIPEEKQRLRQNGQISLSPGLRKIKGLQAEAGVLRAIGSEKDYIQVLRTYCKDVASRLPILREAVEEESPDSFTLQVHALKSASAGIGAMDLSQKAARLEEAGRQGDRDILRRDLAPFMEELSDLAQRIHAALEEADQNGLHAAQLGDAAALAVYGTALRLLRQALQGEDIHTADENMAILEGLPLDASSRETVTTIGEHILIAEFKTALRLTETLLQDETSLSCP
jgi:CheY-like chemotaxis protein